MGNGISMEWIFEAMEYPLFTLCHRKYTGDVRMLKSRPSCAVRMSHGMCWPLYFLWHCIKYLCNALSWYTMKYPTFHLSFSWYTHFPEGSCVWYTTRQRFITSIYIDAGMQFGDAMKTKREAYFCNWKWRRELWIFWDSLSMYLNVFRFKCGLQITDKDKRQVHTSQVNIPLKTLPSKTED